MSAHERLVEALELWVSITGFDEKRRKFSLDDWEIRSMSDSIKQALELDDTNITGFLMLDYFTKVFIEHTNFSMHDLLHDPDRVSDFLNRTKKLLATLEDPEMLDALASFQLGMRKAMRHYRADRPEVMTVIDNRHDITFLRRDALHSMQKLRVDHFLLGESEPEGYTPVYHRDVFQFWNINSLLKTVCSSPSGVSLNLIRTPDDYQSYFVFAIRNGGNVITLTDIADHVHPLQRFMSRRPERAFGKRISKNWFPYDLMNIKYDEESGDLWIEKQDLGVGIAPINQSAFPLSSISELGPHETIWIALMFELIVERFWRKPIEPRALSYTGDMIRVEHSLIEQATAAGLPVKQYHGIDLRPLTVEQVASPSGADLEALGESGRSNHAWMLERYKDKVQEQTLNLMASGDIKALLPADLSPAVMDRKAVVRHDYFNDSANDQKIYFLDATSFGSKDQLIADRMFIARYNLAKDIQRHANAEFKARKKEILAWYRRRIEDNIDRLYALAASDEIWKDYPLPTEGRRFNTKSARGANTVRYLLAQTMTREQQKASYSTLYRAHYFHEGHMGGYKYRCHLTDVGTTTLVAVHPQSKEDLAYLTNTPVDELPDILQHWHVNFERAGNHLLDRIDPLEWALDNPWADRDLFGIRVWLSISAIKKIKKETVLPEGLYPNSTENFVPNPDRKSWHS